LISSAIPTYNFNINAQTCPWQFYMKVFVNQTATFMLCCGQTEVKDQVCPWQLYEIKSEPLRLFHNLSESLIL